MTQTYPISAVMTAICFMLFGSFAASGQTTLSAQTSAGTPDYSQLSYQALTEQTDATKQEINDLNSQIGWLQTLIGRQNGEA